VGVGSEDTPAENEALEAPDTAPAIVVGVGGEDTPAEDEALEAPQVPATVVGMGGEDAPAVDEAPDAAPAIVVGVGGEDAWQQAEAEEAAKQQAEAEEAARQQAEEAARQQAEAEEAARQQAEEAARQQAEAEEAARQQAEEAARQQAEAEEAARQQAQGEGGSYQDDYQSENEGLPPGVTSCDGVARCSSHGQCLEKGSRWRCRCDDGWFGRDCSTPACESAGSCTSCTANPQCRWTGTFCSGDQSFTAAPCEDSNSELLMPGGVTAVTGQLPVVALIGVCVVLLGCLWRWCCRKKSSQIQYNRLPVIEGDPNDVETGGEADDHWDWDDPEEVEKAETKSLLAPSSNTHGIVPTLPAVSGLSRSSSPSRRPALDLLSGPHKPTQGHVQPREVEHQSPNVDLLAPPEPEPAVDVFETLGMNARPSFKSTTSRRPDQPSSNSLAMDPTIASGAAAWGDEADFDELDDLLQA